MDIKDFNPIILEQYLEPTIKIFDIVVNSEGSSQAEKEAWTKEINSFPFIWFNGVQIEFSDINYFELYHEGILPAIQIIFTDRNGIFRAGGFPIDGTVISILINSRHELLRSIRQDFNIFDFKNLGGNSWSIVGILEVPEIFLKKFQSYRNKTSFETLLEISKESNLGFCSNISGTNDRMTRINTGKPLHKFIKEIEKSVYIDNNSFVKIYIDFYYNICFVDIEKELSRDNSDDKGIMSTFELSKETSGLDSDSDYISPIFLTTDKSVKETSNWVESYSITNTTNKKSINKGYEIKTNWIDLDNKSILTFGLSSNMDNDKLNLKTTDDDFYDRNKDYIYRGKITNNVHKDYKYSSDLMDINWSELNKVVLDVDLPNTNFNIYIFQKIKVFLLSDSPNLVGGYNFKRLSGDWIIKDIRFIFKDMKKIQKVRLIRRSLELLDSEIN